MDPVEIRLRNVLREGALLSVGTPLPPGVSLAQVIEQCASKSGWVNKTGRWERDESDVSLNIDTQKPHIKRGIGFAAAFKNVGFSYGFPEQCWATVELQGEAEIDQVLVYHSGADVGQGAHTVFSQMAAEAAGVSVDKVIIIPSDTATSGLG